MKMEGKQVIMVLNVEYDIDILTNYHQVTEVMV